MTRKELAAKMAETADIKKKDAEAALDAFLTVVTDELKAGNAVQLIGFGNFEISERAEREGRNPATGETITIPASKSVHFKAGKKLKELVNN